MSRPTGRAAARTPHAHLPERAEEAAAARAARAAREPAAAKTPSLPGRRHVRQRAARPKG
ncbi:hypothetical protein [Streptomyces sp. NPDC093094]|uniref:hypothetical protein n=1 Tax=Streptomyces sp. NPDC093094 TaxID=3366026 RepID=UPI00380FAC40